MLGFLVILLIAFGIFYSGWKQGSQRSYKAHLKHETNHYHNLILSRSMDLPTHSVIYVMCLTCKEQIACAVTMVRNDLDDNQALVRVDWRDRDLHALTHKVGLTASEGSATLDT